MGYSGLIYAAIVAAWAAFLAPRWVRRNEEVEHAREADAARRVRVLQRPSSVIHAPHGRAAPGVGGNRTMIRNGVPVGPARPPRMGGRVDGRMTSRGVAPTLDARRAMDAMFADAARRRRRILLALLLATVVTTVVAFVGRAPGWAPLVPVALTVWFLFLARRAVVAQNRRRRMAVQRLAPRHSMPQRVAEKPEAEIDETVGRRLVIPDEAADAVDPESWEPVPVPLPTYLTKPAAPPRVARRIDLSRPGSWTSGRLDPASSIELPRRESAEQPSGATAAASAAAGETEVDETPERRRAVGD